MFLIELSTSLFDEIHFPTLHQDLKWVSWLLKNFHFTSVLKEFLITDSCCVSQYLSGELPTQSRPRQKLRSDHRMSKPILYHKSKSQLAVPTFWKAHAKIKPTWQHSQKVFLTMSLPIFPWILNTLQTETELETWSPFAETHFLLSTRILIRCLVISYSFSEIGFFF